MKDTMVSLRSAEAAYFVANTPLFLLRKLREDPAVLTLASSKTSAELLGELRNFAKSNPSSPTEKVKPFVLLAALALKNDIKHLREATLINLQVDRDWFDYIRKALIEMHKATNYSHIDAKQEVVRKISLKSSTPFSRVKLEGK